LTGRGDGTSAGRVLLIAAGGHLTNRDDRTNAGDVSSTAAGGHLTSRDDRTNAGGAFGFGGGAWTSGRGVELRGRRDLHGVVCIRARADQENNFAMTMRHAFMVAGELISFD
jgi:hypothetical protein